MANPFFDAAYYLAHNPDVVAAGYTLATAEQHYLQYGAAESLTDPSRAPNAWFDARAYLAAYPDLVAHGVTAATAFSHYVTYGINENRQPAANVNPADFSYASYAAANPDLLTAFGITDLAHLSALQQHQLLAQYLSYGIHEGRSGVDATVAGSFFAPPAPPAPPGNSAPPVPPTPPILVGSTGVYDGTDGNDVFKGTDVTLNGSTLNGKLGTDTLQAEIASLNMTVTVDSIEKIEISLSSFAFLTVLGSGVDSLAVSSNGNPLIYTGTKVDTISLLSSGGGVFATFTDASGTTDHLNVNVAAGVTTTLGTRDIENFGVNLAANASLTLVSSSSQSPSMAVALTGGTGGFTSKLVVGTGGANQLSVDGSAVAGNLILSADSGSTAVNVTLTGGAGNDTLTGVSDINHITTFNGGAGNDLLVASAGQDLMTGGPGNDNFRFGPGTAAPISLVAGAETVDTIFGLASGDTIELSGRGVSTITYARTDATLALAVAAVEAAINDSDINAIFTLGTQAYFINSGDGTTPSAIIKLVMADNAPFTGQMMADAGGAHFVH